MLRYLIIFTLLLFSIPVLAQEEGEGKKDFSYFEGKSDLFNGSNFESLPFKGTMMFKGHELTQLYRATLGSPLDFPDDEDSDDINLRDAFLDENGNPISQDPLDMQAPNFFLNSIMYYSPKSWTIWLNNNRMRNGHVDKNLKVFLAEENTVEFLWQSFNLETASPNWSAKLVEQDVDSYVDMGDTEEEEKERKLEAFENDDFVFDYKSEDGKIAVDKANGIIKFKLGLNQTFVSSQMQIVEGRSVGQVAVIPEDIDIDDESEDGDGGRTESGFDSEIAEITEGDQEEEDFNELIDEIFEDSEL